MFARPKHTHLKQPTKKDLSFDGLATFILIKCMEVVICGSSHLVRRLRERCHIPMAQSQKWLSKSQLLLVKESLLLAKSQCCR